MVGFLDYVKKLGLLGEKELLKDTRIVLDAGIFFCVHKVRMNNAKHESDANLKTSAYTGGSYLWLADTVKRVVQNFRDNNVEPVCVALNIELQQNASKGLEEFTDLVKKVRDIKKLCQYTLQFPLRHLVIAAVLRELEVEVLVADGGRQVTMVTIANELGCPVLAMYPRPFLYAVHKGVKFIGGENYREYQSGLFSGDGVQVQKWNYQEFTKRLGITENDYAMIAAADELCKTGMENKAERSCVFYERAVRCVQEMWTDEEKTECLLRLSGSQDQDSFEQALEKHRRVARAGPDTATLIEHLRSNEFEHETRNGNILPPAYQKLLRRNLFPASFWSILAMRTTFLQVSEEHPGMKSASLSSRPIRQFSYAILLNFDGPPSAEEYFQNNGEYQPFQTETDNPATDVSLAEVPELTEEERRGILFKALEVEPMTQRKILSSHSPLMSAVVQFWTNHCQPGLAHREAVYYWTQYNFRDKYVNRGFKLPKTFDFTIEEQRELFHPFIQLSSVLQDAVNLNHLLLNPLPEVDINFDVHYLLHMTKAKLVDDQSWESEATSQIQESAADTRKSRPE